MEQYRCYWILFITLSARMIALACEEHRNNQTNSIEQDNNETSSVSMLNCTSSIEEDATSARQKFQSTGRPVSVNTSSTLWINSTITPSLSGKWRTEINLATAFLVWGDFKQENGDYLQFNRRVFRGSSRCSPVPVLIHDKNNKPKSVLIGLKNSSGKANVKFAPIVLDPSFWMISKDVLFCPEVLEYVSTSDTILQSLKEILMSDAATYLNYVNRVQESNVHICNIFQRFKTHCNGFYAAESCGGQ